MEVPRDDRGLGPYGLFSPFRTERQFARNLFESGEFVEVFVDTPLEECERRDVKGLYAKAKRGDLKNFTGIDSAYEPPESPEIHLRTEGLAPETYVDQIVRMLRFSSEAEWSKFFNDTASMPPN